jgi:hypothetical protein
MTDNVCGECLRRCELEISSCDAMAYPLVALTPSWDLFVHATLSSALL